MPKGSLTPISFLFVIITSEYPPCIWKSVSINLSTILSLLDFAISCTIVSVSLVVLNIAPSFTKVSLKVNALVRLPLCAILKPPTWRSAKKGWMFLKDISPVVEYLL